MTAHDHQGDYGVDGSCRTISPHGRAMGIGVDLRRADQSGNSRQATLANAAEEAVADRVEVRTADMPLCRCPTTALT